MISAIVLAAGSSVRMKGPNKLLLAYKDSTIIEHVIHELTASGINEIIVVTGYQHNKISSIIKEQPVICIYNPDHLTGLTSGIQKGVALAKGEGFMICLSDMVTLTKDDYKQLITAFIEKFNTDKECICVPFYNDQKGNPVIFSSHYKKLPDQPVAISLPIKLL